MPICPSVLEKDFCLGEETCMTFLSQLSDTIIQETIRRFYDNNDNPVKYMDHVCYYCSYFVELIELKLIPYNNPILITVFETCILYHCDLNICDYYPKTYNFCHDY